MPKTEITCNFATYIFLRERLETFENGWWCRRQELNPQPSAYKAGALPLSYAGFGTHLRPKYRVRIAGILPASVGPMVC